MRVISGWLGGRNFDSPRGHRTHPMSEKARGGIFGALGDIKGLTVLDAFSGSGALAIEAISRGAKSAVAIEVDKGAHTVIKKNVANLNIEDRVKSVRAFVVAWSTRNQAQTFNLIFADPPYHDIPYRDLKSLPRHLDKDGIFVLSWPAKGEFPKFDGLELIKINNYNDNKVAFFKKL